jgi:hypothetical protein
MKRFYRFCTLPFILLALSARSQSAPPWSAWQTIYTVEGNAIQFSFFSRGCSGTTVRGWPRYRTLNGRAMPKCYLKFKFDYHDCEGKVQTESVTVMLEKAGIDDDPGKWFTGKDVIRFHSFVFQDYRPKNQPTPPGSSLTGTPTVAPEPVESPEARQQREADERERRERAEAEAAQRREAERQREEEARQRREAEEEARRRTDDLRQRSEQQQQNAAEATAAQAALAAGMVGVLGSDGREAVKYDVNRWAVLGGLSMSMQNMPVLAQRTGGSEVAESVLAYGATAYLEAYPIRGPYFGLGALGDLTYNFSVTGSGRDESILSYTVGGRILLGVRNVKLLGEYQFGRRSLTLESQDDLYGATYGQRTWATANYAVSRLGGGLLLEWGHRSDEDTERSLLLAGYLETPAYLHPATPPPLVWKLALRSYLDLSAELGLNYPLAGAAYSRLPPTGSYWFVRMGRTFTLGAKARR